MTRRRKLVLVGATLVALGAGGYGVAQATGGESDEQATGPEAEQAKRAALASVGGGRVVGVERENEGNVAWEVEIEQTDGRSAEVDLNQNLERVGLDRDDERGEHEGAGEEKGADDDRGADDDKDQGERQDED